MRPTPLFIWAIVGVVALVGAACSSGSGSGAAGSFCDLAQDRVAAESALADIDVLDPDAVKQGFDENRDLIDRAVDLAPDEIKDDLEIVQQDFERTYEALDAADFDALSAAEPEDVADAEGAGRRIDQYIRDVCGVDPDADDDAADDEIADELEESGRGDDVVADALEQAGLERSEAECLSTRLTIDDLLAVPSDGLSPEIEAAFGGCGISFDRLAELGGADQGWLDVAPEELTGAPLDVLVQELVSSGFTEDEATCIAESMFNSDDSGDVLAAFETCDISLSRLAELGDG